MEQTAVVGTISGGRVVVTRQYRSDRVCRLDVRRNSETIQYHITPEAGKLVGVVEDQDIDAGVAETSSTGRTVPAWAREAVLEVGVDEVIV